MLHSSKALRTAFAKVLGAKPLVQRCTHHTRRAVIGGFAVDDRGAVNEGPARHRHTCQLPLAASEQVRDRPRSSTRSGTTSIWRRADSAHDAGHGFCYLSPPQRVLTQVQRSCSGVMKRQIDITLTASTASTLVRQWASPSLRAIGELLQAVRDDCAAEAVELYRWIEPATPPTFPENGEWLRVAACGATARSGMGDCFMLDLSRTTRKLQLRVYRGSPVDPANIEILAVALESMSSGFIQAMTAELIRETVQQLSEADRVNASWVAHGEQDDHAQITKREAQEIARALRAVAVALQFRLAGLQVDVYLADPNGDPSRYRQAALAGVDVAGSPKEYRRDDTHNQSGLTAWSIAHNTPVVISDLNSFDRGREYYDDRYPGAAPRLRRRPLDLGEVATAVVVPIRSSTGQHGFLRILGVEEPGPTYLSESVLTPLTQVADLIGRYFSRWSALSSLRQLPVQLQRFNEFPANSLDFGEARETVLGVGLKAVLDLIPSARRTAVRLIREAEDETTVRCLEYAAVEGPGWGRKSDPASKRRKVFPLSGQHQSIGRHVIETGQAIAVDHSQDPPTKRDATFDDETHLVCAPIRSRNTIVGVLDVRSVQIPPFSQHDLAVARTVAAMMGQHLAAVEHQREFSHGFSDLAHQVENPLSKALRRVENLVERGTPANPSLEFRRVRGLLRKSSAVARNAEIFGLLASGGEISIDDALPHRFEEVDRLVREYRDDYQLASETDKKLIFRFDSTELEAAMGGSRAVVSFPVLNQALGCLLDNAEKYSRSDSLIAIRARRVGSRLVLTVSSEGLLLSPAEARLVTRRGYRGAMAEAVTSEGYGLGLWIVDRLMSAHPGAELEIHPTNARGITTVDLHFSLRKAGR